MPQFNSVRDESDAIEYIFRKLDEKSGISQLKVNQHHSIDKAIEILELRREKIDELGDDTPDWETDKLQNLLVHIRIALSGIDPEERQYVDNDSIVPANWNPSDAFQWGEWRLVNSQHLEDSNGNPLGYSPNGELVKSLVPPWRGCHNSHLLICSIGNCLAINKNSTKRN